MKREIKLRDYFDTFEELEANKDRLIDLRETIAGEVPTKTMTFAVENVLEQAGFPKGITNVDNPLETLEEKIEIYDEQLLSIATEAWALDSLFDTLKTTEKINGELKDNIAIFKNKKEWYESGVMVLNSVGIFNYLMHGNGKVEDIATASKKSAAILNRLNRLSTDLMQSATKGFDLYKSADIKTDSGVADLLTKLQRTKFVNESDLSELMGAYTLGNRIIEVKRKQNKPAQDTFSISISKSSFMPATKELDSKTKKVLQRSGFVTAAAGLLAFALGATTVVLSGALTVGIIIGKGASKVGAHLKSTFTETHEISFESIGGALQIVHDAVEKATEMKRNVTTFSDRNEKYRKAFKDDIDKESLSKEGISDLKKCFNILTHIDRFALEATEVTLALALILAKGSNGIARKL